MIIHGKPQKGEGGDRYTIKSLRLNLKAAHEGKTWLLLPQGFRDQQSGLDYPLPARRNELQKLVAIPIPPHIDKRDCGCMYLRRALKKFKAQEFSNISALSDLGRRREQIKSSHRNYNTRVRELRQEMRKAVDQVKEEAQVAIASLNDLFALGRKGIDGQMRAHLESRKWPHHAKCKVRKCHDDCQGEHIDSAAFRQCFRMVTQAVKGLGLPTDQRAEATDAIVEEYAASLKATQEALAMAPSDTKDGKEETEH
jgi:hypothetical protein